MNNRQIVSFSILHAVSALLLPLLVFLLGGCLEPELTNKPGPEIPCATVEKALNDTLSGPWTYEVGEFVHIQDTAAPVNQPANVIRDITQLVLHVTPQTGYTTLRIEQTEEKEGKRDTTEGNEYVPGTFDLCSGTAKQTYHNLTVKKSRMPVPKRSQDACDARFVGCEMNVSHIKFDKLVTTTTGESLPVHVFITTSNEVPYLSRIVQFCVTVPLETNGPRIPVTQCSTVKNFTFKAP